MKVDKIYLVGFMGAGKTSVGQCLQRSLGWDFCDLDVEAESRMGQTISDCFRKYGETHFRQMERLTLLSTLDRRRIVIAAGGGAFVSPENTELMLCDGLVVWLDVPFRVLAERVGKQANVRPLFRNLKEAEALYERRLLRYGRAHLQLDGTLPVKEIVRQIIRERAGALL